LLFFCLFKGTYKDNEFVEVYMIIRDDLDLSTVVLQESEVEEVRWIPWRELKKEASVPDSNYVPWDEPKYSGFWAYMEKTFG
jgi:isopentenyldiphosphate isomerase